VNPQPPADALLTLDNVSVSYQNSPILIRINLDLFPNQIVTLIGPNGSGKTTLVKTALGLVKPDSGTRKVDDKLSIGYVPQTVSIGSSLPLTVQGFLRLKACVSDKKIAEAIELVSAEKTLKLPLSEVSGGEMRRILLARALINPPQLLILDEPTAGVDINGQDEIYHLISSIKDHYRCSILLVSHDLHIVMATTDKVICLNHHICCSGSPEQVSDDPEFINLFGRRHAQNLAIYRHHHDHVHAADGHVHNQKNG
jgi:zinc transport system ATP-binding protein